MADDYRKWALLYLAPSKKYLSDLLNAKITVKRFSHNQKITAARLFLPDGGLRYVRDVLKRLPWQCSSKKNVFSDETKESCIV